ALPSRADALRRHRLVTGPSVHPHGLAGELTGDDEDRDGLDLAAALAGDAMLPRRQGSVEDRRRAEGNAVRAHLIASGLAVDGELAGIGAGIVLLGARCGPLAGGLARRMAVVRRLLGLGVGRRAGLGALLAVARGAGAVQGLGAGSLLLVIGRGLHAGHRR